MRIRTAIAVVAALLGAIGPLGVRAAAAAPAPATPRVAVFSPLLDFFGFGAAVGIPEVCDVARGAAANVAGATGTAVAADPVLIGVASACAQASTNGTATVNQFKRQVAPLAPINKPADQVINAVADLLVTIGTQDAKAVAPFGPTLVTLGADVRFFAVP